MFAAFLLLATTAVPPRLAPVDPIADRLVAEAIRVAPERARARANVDAARSRIEPARTPADPIVSFSYQNDGRDLSFGDAEGSFLGVMLSQAVPWPGKLALAGKTARSAARELEVGEQSRLELSIEARVRNAWYDLLLARALDQLLEERRTTAKQIAASVRDRYAAGLAAQQDALRAEVEVARIEESFALQQAEIVSRSAELHRLLGRSQDGAIEDQGALPADADVPPAADVVAGVLLRSPELAAAKQGLETGRIGIAMVEKSFFPDFVVSAGSMSRGSFEMGPMWQIGVGVSIPAWSDRRQRNQLAEAHARVAAREAENEVLARELELRTRERLAQLDAARRIVALDRDTILPLDELALESALASYRSGKVPFISVLEAMNALYGDRARSLARLAECAKWRVAIDEGGFERRSQKAETGSEGPSMSSSAAMSSMR